MIEFHCHTCNRLLRTSDEKAGRTAQCPGCGETVTVPYPDREPEPAGNDEFGESYGAAGDERSEYEDYDEFDTAPRRPARRRRARTRSSQGQNTLAIVSLITGVLGLAMMFVGFCCGCLFFFSLPLDLTAVITGAVALNQIAKQGGEGKPMAIGGIACGAVALVAVLALLALGIAMNFQNFQQPNQFNF